MMIVTPTVSRLNIRSGPGLGYSVIHVASRYERLELLDPAISASWNRVRAGSIEAYAAGWLLEKMSELPVFKFEHWPTDYKTITQVFGANPQNYRRYGLPGHEGVDIRAPHRSNIYAVASGTVYRVHTMPPYNNYGNHVRIEHAGGYKTIYAHFNECKVAAGDVVSAGQVIGLANNTGNSFGSHLHLTLKHDGATGNSETNYPSDIIDPTPFLDIGTTPLPTTILLFGVHGRADGRLIEADYQVIQQSRVKAVKVLVNTNPDAIDRIRSFNPSCFFVARLFADLRDKRVATASDFAQWQEYDMRNLYNKGVRYFEVHNEPNLVMEGCGSSWSDGTIFGMWLRAVVDVLKPKFPEAKFGFPGLSPGGDVYSIRKDAHNFFSDAYAICKDRCDWIGAHSYWTSFDNMSSEYDGLSFKYYLQFGKPVMITEFSNPSAATKLDKATQYVNYYNLIKNSGVMAAFCFVSSASSGFQNETWVETNGNISVIPERLARLA